VSEVNQTIPSFVNGVSKQAVESRHVTQVEEMVNCSVSFVDGTRRRAPLEKIAELPDLDGTKPYLYSYERGDGVESYLVAILSGAWFVYDLDGNKVDQGTDSYLDVPVGSDPVDVFTSTTIGDTTFIVNKTKNVAKSSAFTHGTSNTTQNQKYAYYWVKRSYIAYGGMDNQQAATYQYKITNNDGTTSTTSTRPTNTEANSGSCSIETDADNPVNITEDLCTDSSIGGTWTSHPVGSNAYGKNTLTVANTLAGDIQGSNSGSVVRKLKWNGSGEPTGTWEVSDTWGNMASEGWWGYISKVQDLPSDMGAYSGSNTLVKVTGDEKNNFEGFWTTYEDGIWKESVASGLSTGLDKATMPHTLVRTSLTNFTFGEFDYSDRKVGDEFTNPMPSFFDEDANLGYPIEDVFFYRNRFGMISRDSIILSEVGIYENFFRTTVTDLLASDPVDVAVDSNKVVNLKYAVPFKRNLLLFGANAQYILSSENELRPDTVSISQSTEYSLNPNTKPIAIGPNTYFTVNKGKGTQVREYYNVPDSVDNIAEDVTAHVSEYIPKNAVDLEGSDKYDMLFILAEGEPVAGEDSPERANIYIYNQTWEGTKKAQSAWHKWDLAPANTHILAIRVFRDDLYMICHFNDPEEGVQGEMVLKKISLAKTDYENAVYMDLVGDDPNNLEGLTYSSSIELSEWGFNAGGTSKVDDKQGRLQIRSIELQARTGSTQQIKVQVGDAVATTDSDTATVMGETKNTKITIQSIPVEEGSDDTTQTAKGFCIDSTNLKGRFTSRSRAV